LTSLRRRAGYRRKAFRAMIFKILLNFFGTPVPWRQPPHGGLALLTCREDRLNVAAREPAENA
jgi:hypothetical protein